MKRVITMDDFEKVLKLLGEINQRQKEMHTELKNEMKKGFAEAKREREFIKEIVVNNKENITGIHSTLDEIKSDQRSIHELLGEHQFKYRK